MKKIFLSALIIRLICLYAFRNVNNYDLQSYLQAGELTLNKINIYPDVANLHHPYLPFFLYFEAFAFYFKKFNINPIIILKSINIIFDLGNLYLVYLLSKKNLKTAFLYAVNPVTILIATFHGQFDVIPIFFLLWSVYLISFSRHLAEGRDPVFTILIFSAAVMTKTWPFLFIFSFYKKLNNKLLILLIPIFPLISIFIYLILFKSSINNILQTIAGYQGLWGIWGIWALLGKWRLRWQKISTLIFLICFFVNSHINKNTSIVKEILYLLFFFFVFTPNFSIQYFAWIIPFLIIIKPKKYIQLILLITLTLISYYATPNLIIFQEITQFATWILFIYSFYIIELTEATDLR